MNSLVGHQERSCSSGSLQDMDFSSNWYDNMDTSVDCPKDCSTPHPLYTISNDSRDVDNSEDAIALKKLSEELAEFQKREKERIWAARKQVYGVTPGRQIRTVLIGDTSAPGPSFAGYSTAAAVNTTSNNRSASSGLIESTFIKRPGNSTNSIAMELGFAEPSIIEPIPEFHDDQYEATDEFNTRQI